MKKPKVIILYNKLFHYRVPIWNCLADNCLLTVAYSEGDDFLPESIEVRFQTLYLPAISLNNRFIFQKTNIRRLVKNYDVVIAYGDIAWLKYSTLPWFSKNKVIFHTIGVSASYEKGFDQVSKWDRIRAFFYRRATALAFYTEYPIEKYASMGFPREMMFVAHNTVAVQPIKENVKKNSILFVGTLYRQKGIQNLLEVYKKLNGNCKLPVLNIVGGGPDFECIQQWINENDMNQLIHLIGAVYDINEKAKYFAKAFACVSPLQAGLAVQESMGYGVPFVTTRHAITGGEIFDIKNGENGVLMEDISQLSYVIMDIANNPSRYELMGLKAQEFYNQYRKPSDMADGLWQAVRYALKQ